MIRQLVFSFCILLAILTSNVLAQVPTVRCDVGAKIACNNFRSQKGKVCALDPSLCYNQDAVENEKPCIPATEDLCATFKNHKGYLCTDFFCLTTA